MSIVNIFTLGIVSVDSAGNYTMNWSYFVYLVVCILIEVNIVGWLFGRGQSIAAGLTGALLALIFYFYYLRFFTKSPTKEKPSDSCGAVDAPPPCAEWPPIVNMCPDFMVAWTDSNKNVYCYDANNTYNMKTGTGAGLITGLTINGVAGQSAYLIKLGSGTAKNLASDTNGSTFPLLALLGGKAGGTSLATGASSSPGSVKGELLRWEGVYAPGNSQDASALTNAPMP